jgi:uncharacterized membrane protein YgcG
MSSHNATAKGNQMVPSLFSRRFSTSVLLLILVPVLLCILAGAAPGAPGGKGAQVTTPKTWEFERFDTAIKVNKDGSLSVRETQVVNFTGSFSFLNRDLVGTKAGFSEGRSYGRVRFKDIKVFDLQGTPYKSFTVEKLTNGRRVHITFSAYNQTKGWIIEYRMKGAVIYSERYDRLYFNTVSTDRSVPIKSSKATVALPAGADMSKVRTSYYVDSSNPPEKITSGRDGGLLWWKAVNIPAYSPVTIDVAFPKGTVAVPLTYRSGFGALMISLAYLLALGAGLVMLLLWLFKGRDIKAPELDVVRYTPPENLKPMEVAFLLNESTSSSDISATIVDLAIRGKLVITEQEGGTVFKHKEYGFQLKDRSAEELDSFEKDVINALFESGESVTQDDLKNEFYTHIPGITEKVKKQVLKKRLFDGDPQKVKHRYTLIALIALLPIVAVVLLNLWIDPGYLYALIPGFAVAGLLIFIFGWFMPRRTAKGSEALSYVKGFKEYMATAEAGEMEFMTPENFQVNLPYAMVLKVADKWAGKFADIYTSPPDWYVSTPGTTFSTLYLADSLTSMQTSVGGTLASSPSSSGGGGGGFGGGGGGGGFGGGGSSAG